MGCFRKKWQSHDMLNNVGKTMGHCIINFWKYPERFSVFISQSFVVMLRLIGLFFFTCIFFFSFNVVLGGRAETWYSWTRAGLEWVGNIIVGNINKLVNNCITSYLWLQFCCPWFKEMFQFIHINFDVSQFLFVKKTKRTSIKHKTQN